MRITGGWEGPYPDENAYSMIARMAEYLVVPNHYAAILQLFGKYRQLSPYVLKPLKESDLERWELEGVDSAEYYREHVLQHSAYPVYGTMLRVRRMEQLHRLMSGEPMENGHERYLTRAMHCTVLRKTALYYCPACAREETQQYGEPYWHVMHQIPGVEICTKHGLVLCKTNATMAYINSRFIPLTYVINIEGTRKEQEPDGEEASMFQETAEDIGWLMEHGLQLGGLEQIKAVTNRRLHNSPIPYHEIYREAVRKYDALTRQHRGLENIDFPDMEWYKDPTYLELVVFAQAVGGVAGLL